MKRAMIGRSLSTILVVTHDKFGRASLERVCRLTQISDIVTDRQVSSEFRTAAEAAGPEFHVFEERA